MDAATAGTISGKVVFKGTPPAMPAIDMSSNPQCERSHKTAAKAETVLVNPDGSLRNVFIWIKSGLPAGKWAVPTTTVRFDQDGCVYSPHVVGLMTGQTLEIYNSDPVNHNVHAESKVNKAWNFSEPPKAEHISKTFDSPEVLFAMSCSVHPWMRAYVGVSPHPFFAVSGDTGSFELKGVPPGTYVVEAVHEKFGRKEATLTLEPSGKATLEFSYGS